MARASPPEAPGPTSSATPARPASRPAQRMSVSRSASPVTLASSAPMMGTDAISRPLMELDSLSSASESSSHGEMISTTAKITSQRQYGSRMLSSPRRSAMGSSSAAPMATRARTSTGTGTPPTAILISRYGTPQITLMVAKSTQPRRLTSGSPLVGPLPLPGRRHHSVTAAREQIFRPAYRGRVRPSQCVRGQAAGCEMQPRLVRIRSQEGRSRPQASSRPRRQEADG